MGHVKDIIYGGIVKRNAMVRYEYERFVMEHIEEHNRKRLLHWKVLWKLNWHYRIKKNEEPLLYKDVPEKRVEVRQSADAQLQVPESAILNRPKPYHFALGLLHYDVISFDVFDTLLFRPFQHPADLFNIIGKRLNYPAVFTGFKQGRYEAEREARNQLENDLGIREVNIYEIYDQVERKLGIDKEKGIEAEIKAEQDYLFANPYMKIVYNILRSQGKTIVLTSDMYIPGRIMEKLIRKCGYDGFEHLYVSCDYRCNKTSGELFRRVLQDYPDKKIVHIGDNQAADIAGAKKAGLEARYYKNVNEAGKAYRPDWMAELTGSAYTGLINAYIHNGLNKYPFFYEYGFIYGGVYVLGFCEWIRKRVKEEQIDKLIFLSRDGDISQKIYNKYFESIPNDYIFWSRMANLKYLIEINQDAFIDRVIKQKALGTLDVELSSIFECFSIKADENILMKYGLYPNSVLCRENMEAFKRFIKDNWEMICRNYEEEKILVRDEVKAIIGSSKKIAVIDVGWTGSGPLGFKHFVNTNISPDIEIKCWMAGGAGGYGSGVSVLPYYMDGTLESYLFSPFHNKRNAQIHVSENVAVVNNAVFELFTQTQYPSFRGMTVQGEYVFDIPENENYEMIAQIHKGIIDFCELYRKTFSIDTYLYNISGFDAYRPFAKLAFNKQFFERNFRNVVFGYGLSGDNIHQCIETIGKRVEHYYANIRKGK